MAVFTIISADTFAHWARAEYGFKEVAAPTAITEGIENTNYRFRADGKDYVFTIFELWDAGAVAYYTALTRHLAAAGQPAPAPVTRLGDKSDTPAMWENKPCVVVPFADGASNTTPDEEHCRRMGEVTARLHKAAANFSGCFPNPRGGMWRQHAAEKVRPHLDTAQAAILGEALQCDAQFNDKPLPAAACHCDLFRNNVLWQNGDISAVIDFYFGGDDTLIFDLAVCACDWCFDFINDEHGAFSPSRLEALLHGYAVVRNFCHLEKTLFADALCSAASRFWLSRCYDWHFPRDAVALKPHPPRRFETILQAAINMRADIARLMKAVA